MTNDNNLNKGSFSRNDLNNRTPRKTTTRSTTDRTRGTTGGTADRTRSTAKPTAKSQTRLLVSLKTVAKRKEKE